MNAAIAQDQGKDDTHSVPTDPFPEVTQRVRSWVDRGYYPGCSVWIAKGDKLLYQKDFGSGSQDSETFIASAGKWLGAAVILAVVDEGKLTLDDTVEKWLPEFRGNAKGKVTLRQLFSHTSGYPPYQPKDRPLDNFQTLEESVCNLLPLAPRHVPGTEFEYGGLAMQVAGRMTEVATGKDWETIFQEKIARPLGMTHSHFIPVDAGHAPMIGGGAVSTVHDYARFLTMIGDGGIFEGRRILSAKAIAEMEADQVGGATVLREEFVERRRGNTHRSIYGLGMWREELDSSGEAILMSSPSWAGTYPWVDKRHDIRGVIIAHVDVSRAGKAAFSGFWTSPVLMNLVRAALEWRAPRELAEYECGVAQVTGGDLAYEAAGSGEPVILLHGHSFDRRMWDPQFAELAKHFRVIRYDLRGYGLSDMPTEAQDFRHADDLAALMDALKISKAHVVGLSLGGFVVEDFIALHSDRILTATIASGAVYDGPGSSRTQGEKRAQRLAEIEGTRAQGIGALKDRWLKALLGDAPHSTTDFSPLLSAMIRDWSAWQPLHVEPALTLGPVVLEKIAALRPTVPVLWIAGAHDSYQGQVDAFKAVLPELRLVVIPNAGHLCSLEQPAAFNLALTEFIQASRIKPRQPAK